MVAHNCLEVQYLGTQLRICPLRTIDMHVVYRQAYRQNTYTHEIKIIFNENLYYCKAYILVFNVSPTIY